MRPILFLEPQSPAKLKITDSLAKRQHESAACLTLREESTHWGNLGSMLTRGLAPPDLT